MGETAVEEPRKRGRPAKPESEKKRKATDEVSSEPKRGRGRPKGSGKKKSKSTAATTTKVTTLCTHSVNKYCWLAY